MVDRHFEARVSTLEIADPTLTVVRFKTHDKSFAVRALAGCREWFGQRPIGRQARKQFVFRAHACLTVPDLRASETKLICIPSPRLRPELLLRCILKCLGPKNEDVLLSAEPAAFIRNCPNGRIHFGKEFPYDLHCG